MHRSGTSLIARLFHAAGLDLGDEKTFYRPDRWNPDGYFEQPDIHAINFPLINGPLWKFAYFWLPSESTILHRAEKLAPLIKKTALKYDAKIIKETRFCLTLPAWVNHGARVEKIICCLRDPIQVARSLSKRNWITLNHAFRLWKEHNIRLLKATQDLPVHFVYYQDILNDPFPYSHLRDALAFFDVSLSDSKLAELAQKNIKPSMNNNPETNFNYPADIAELWNQLLRRYKSQKSSDLFYAN